MLDFTKLSDDELDKKMQASKKLTQGYIGLEQTLINSINRTHQQIIKNFLAIQRIRQRMIQNARPLSEFLQRSSFLISANLGFIQQIHEKGTKLNDLHEQMHKIAQIENALMDEEYKRLVAKKEALRKELEKPEDNDLTTQIENAKAELEKIQREFAKEQAEFNEEERKLEKSEKQLVASHDASPTRGKNRLRH